MLGFLRSWLVTWLLAETAARSCDMLCPAAGDSPIAVTSATRLEPRRSFPLRVFPCRCVSQAFPLIRALLSRIPSLIAAAGRWRLLSVAVCWRRLSAALRRRGLLSATGRYRRTFCVGIKLVLAQAVVEVMGHVLEFDALD